MLTINGQKPTWLIRTTWPGFCPFVHDENGIYAYSKQERNCILRWLGQIQRKSQSKQSENYAAPVIVEKITKTPGNGRTDSPLLAANHPPRVNTFGED
ncbi:MAG: hypothetical protein FH749_06745 [Firmicutes bacterium]|nr:hypothetical protein [Bacillota bacterium]